MTARARRALLVVSLVGVLALPGCGGARPDALPASATAPVAAPVGSAVATVDGVELRVTGFHVFPAAEGDPQAQAAANGLGVPAAGVVQLHLMLQVHNTGASERTVAGDLLRLVLAGRTVEPLPGPLLPTATLSGGSVHEAAAGFWVALRTGSGPPVLRWTHGGRTTALPLGSVRRSA